MVKLEGFSICFGDLFIYDRWIELTFYAFMTDEWNSTVATDERSLCRDEEKWDLRNLTGAAPPWSEYAPTSRAPMVAHTG